MRRQNKYWYAVYTRPRWEKKVHERALMQGFESYCPLNVVRKRWSDRYKTIEEPLFKSYLFVKLSDEELTTIRFIDGVVNFVYWLGKPAKIKDSDIIRIKKFLNEYSDISVEAIPAPKPGDKVKVDEGVFMDQEGIVLSVDKKKVEIRIESLGVRLVAQIDRNKVSIK